MREHDLGRDFEGSGLGIDRMGTQATGVPGQMSEMVADEVPDAAVDDPAVPDDLWTCRPSIRDDVVTRQVDGQMLVWPPDATIGSVDPVATVVLSSLDGTSELGEIAEDFALAAEVADDDARRFVGQLVRRLAAVGVLDGLDSVLEDLLAVPDATDGEAPAPRADVGDADDEVDGVDERDSWSFGVPAPTAAVDLDDEAPTDGSGAPAVLQLGPDELAALTTRVEEEHDEQGRKTTTTYLANGSKIVSTEIVVRLGGADAQLGALIDGRSPAELAPGDTCLGSKLRMDEDVELVNIESGPVVSSVRCDHDDVRARLTAQPGITLAVDNERGPVEAFVVRPYEGDGPVRVYDGMGRRRGRPRTSDEVVALVSEIVADDVLGRRDRVHLAGDLVSHRGDAVLLPLGALGIPRLARALQRCGLEPHWGRPVLADHGTVEVPRAMPPEAADDDRERFILRAVLGRDPQRTGSPRVELVEHLLGSRLRSTATARAEALDTVVDLTATVTTVPLSDLDVDSIVATVAALLGVSVPLSL